jgi:hypothetical protein
MAKIRLDLGYVPVQDVNFKDVRMIIKPKSISNGTLHKMFWMKTSTSLLDRLSKMTLAQQFWSLSTGWQMPLQSLPPALRARYIDWSKWFAIISL